MLTIHVAEWDKDLLGRCRGAALRDSILDQLTDDSAVEFDFTGVQALSLSFADECFGELVSILRARPNCPTINFANTTPDQQARLRVVLADRTALAAA